MAVFALKHLKTTIKESSNPIEFFLNNNANQNKLTREICFYRLVGINCSESEYINSIQNIDKILQKENQHIPYIRLGCLKTFSTDDNLTKYAAIYDGWVLLKNEDFKMQFNYALPFTFRNDILELTFKKAFLRIMAIYESQTPNATASMVKNFGIKLLYWIDLYFPLIFKEKAQEANTFPKILFTGKAKKTESLFLYFLSLMGCDLLYMNPAADLPDCYQEIIQGSKFYNCGPLKNLTMPVPEFIAPKILEADKQMPISFKKEKKQNNIVSRPNEFNLPDSNKKELSYEEIATLSSCVVMIKVYDDQNNVFQTGSGVVINEEGLILTNFHVINSGVNFAVQFENDSEVYFTDCLVKYNYNYDLAIIKSNKLCNPINISKNPKLLRGQKVVAIGSPLGLFNTVSDGIISGFRNMEHISMIQFTAPISKGSSGGALLDMRGSLIGIITAGYDDGQNLNLAVDCNTIVKFAQNFLK